MPHALFPDADRVVYDRAPLFEVVCELRFPQILRIEAEPPVQFQELIRGRFPLFERVQNPAVRLPGNVAQALGIVGSPNSYAFRLADKSSHISLTSTNLSLSNFKYTRWEDFSVDLMLAIQSLIECYAPSFFSRVGLRYQNVINKQELGLTETPLNQLLRAEVLGELCDAAWETAAFEVQRSIRIPLDQDEDALLFQHGIAEINYPNGLKSIGYMLDFDFYTDKITEHQDVAAIINRLHSYSGKAFRWAITDKLHQHLGPSVI